MSEKSGEKPVKISNIQTMRVKLWGTRGSLPVSHSPELIRDGVRHALEAFFEAGHRSRADIDRYLECLPRQAVGGFGGNTTCIEVRSRDQQVILDGGSGIRPLGYELMTGPCGKGQGEAHIFFTHFHWDHLIGLPFFVPLFVPGNRIHVYSVQPELEEMFRVVFRKPYFPVPLERLGAEIEYHILEPRKPVQVGDLTLTPYALDHPDPSWGYRIEKDGKVFSHCVDTECVRVSRDQLGPDLPLYQNADLMTFDAQYTLMETIERVNWGHAAALLGIDIAMRERVKQVVFMHHDPASSDTKIAQAEAQARQYYNSQLRAAEKAGLQAQRLEWSFGYDGMTVDL